MVKQQPHAARFRLAANSPWLSFGKDEMFSHFAALARWGSKPKRKSEDDSAQMERLGWILALADEDDDWPDDDADDDDAPIRISERDDVTELQDKLARERK